MNIIQWLFVDQPSWVSNASNLTSITIFGALIGFYRKFNCNQPGCKRIGHHKVDGTTYRTCTKHTTALFHDSLKKKHAAELPEQHKLLNSAKRIS